MLLGRDDELFDDVVLELAEPVEVGAREHDREDIGDQDVTAARGDRPVVHRLADRARDLDRLDLGLEGACEDTVDGPLEPTLDPVEDSHRAPPSRDT